MLLSGKVIMSMKLNTKLSLNNSNPDLNYALLDLSLNEFELLLVDLFGDLSAPISTIVETSSKNVADGFELLNDYLETLSSDIRILLSSLRLKKIHLKFYVDTTELIFVLDEASCDENFDSRYLISLADKMKSYCIQFGGTIESQSQQIKIKFKNQAAHA